MRSTLTWMATAWLTLIALEVFATSKTAPGAIKSLFGDLDAFVQAALDPNVPAIRDRRATS